MSTFLQGKPDNTNRDLKYFGYILSTLFLIFTGIALVGHSSLTPWLFLITMYLLTGSLWISGMIRPLYKWYRRITGKK